MGCLLAVLYRPLRHDALWERGHLALKIPHSEAKMRAASLAPGYLRISYLIIKL